MIVSLLSSYPFIMLTENLIKLMPLVLIEYIKFEKFEHEKYSSLTDDEIINRKRQSNYFKLNVFLSLKASG